jgi:hypothetical protein
MMKRFEIIFLDVDDTLLNFIPSWVARFGLSMEEVLPNWIPGHYYGGYQAIRQSMKIHPTLDPDKYISKMTSEMLKDELFWLSLRPEPWFGELIDLCRLYSNQLHFITSPSIGGVAARIGKLKWFERYQPKYVERVHVLADKWMFAAPGRLLIDDADHNVNQWTAGFIDFPRTEEHESFRMKTCKGDALIFPRHHNKGYRERETPMKGLISAWEKL